MLEFPKQNVNGDADEVEDPSPVARGKKSEAEQAEVKCHGPDQCAGEGERRTRSKFSWFQGSFDQRLSGESTMSKGI